MWCDCLYILMYVCVFMLPKGMEVFCPLLFARGDFLELSKLATDMLQLHSQGHSQGGGQSCTAAAVGWMAAGMWVSLRWYLAINVVICSRHFHVGTRNSRRGQGTWRRGPVTRPWSFWTRWEEGVVTYWCLCHHLLQYCINSPCVWLCLCASV